MKLSTKGRYGGKGYGGPCHSLWRQSSFYKNYFQKAGFLEYYLEQLFSSLRKAKLIKV